MEYSKLGHTAVGAIIHAMHPVPHTCRLLLLYYTAVHHLKRYVVQVGQHEGKSNLRCPQSHKIYELPSPMIFDEVQFTGKVTAVVKHTSWAGPNCGPSKE